MMLAIESAVLDMLLAGDDETLALLRAQRDRMHVSERKYSGCGFFTSFGHPPDAIRIPPTSGRAFGDVYAAIPGLAHGAGFVLFFEDGLLDFLEGYTHGEDWGEDPPWFVLGYMEPVRKLSGLC